MLFFKILVIEFTVIAGVPIYLIVLCITTNSTLAKSLACRDVTHMSMSQLSGVMPRESAQEIVAGSLNVSALHEEGEEW